MPVLATPSPVVQCPCSPPSPNPVLLTAVPCDGQNILSAPISQLYKKPLLNRMRAIMVRGGQRAIIRWQMHDSNGNPVNLTECLECLSSSDSSISSETPPEFTGQVGLPESHLPKILLGAGPVYTANGPLLSDSPATIGSVCRAPYELKLRIREDLTLGRDHRPSRFEFPAYIFDAATGVVQAVLEPGATKSPGIYFAEMALCGDVGSGPEGEYVLFSNTFYIAIDRANWSRRGPSGPPSIAEIRLHLRDSDSAESYLLDNLRWDNAEIAMATCRAIDYWNEIPPDVCRFTTANFPFRYHLMEGICAQLFMSAAESYRANHLQYSAAGVSVNDQDKEPNYEAVAQRRQQVWTEFVKRKKSEINLNACWGGIGSPYGFYGYSNRQSETTPWR